MTPGAEVTWLESHAQSTINRGSVRTDELRPRTASTNGHARISAPAEPPRPKLSIVRVLALIGVLAGAGAAVVFAVRAPAPNAAALHRAAPWYAPYVDVTLTPTYAFQSPAANPVSGVFLSFIVAEPSRPCTPSWGGYYTLDQAATSLNLDERISQVRAQGGSAMLSYGGQANTELAAGCASLGDLTAAYLAPVERYKPTAIDLDIEGAALGNPAVTQRRALAIAAVQRAQAQRGRRLGVWLTLPVDPSGLGAAGEAEVRAMLAAHVVLNGVNVMAMDFGQPVRDMIVPVTRSLDAAHDQLQALYRSSRLRLGSDAAWRHLGVTVMIGQNDVAGERFTTADAHTLSRFVAERHLARVSIWSLNRDSQCGSVFAQTGVLSNTCSGVSQSPLQFTKIFSRLAGTRTAAMQNANAVPAVQAAPADVPASSPYPIWQPTASYVTGYKVVWHRDVYEAKWFSQGQAPDTPAPSGGQTPWLLLGPVPAGATAPKPILLVSAKHPQWSAAAIYHQGDLVSFDGLPYEAKWYTHGDPPSGTLPADPNSPWQPMYTVPGEPGSTTTGGATQ
jgi:chitinase